jgi:S1-C subfamily serine protease
VSVLRGGSAEKSGLVSGDLMISLNGRIVTSVDDVHRLLSGFQTAQSLSISVVRDGKIVERTVESRMDG